MLALRFRLVNVSSVTPVQHEVHDSCAGVLTPCQFTGCSFGAAAIWQYESLKSRVQSYMDEARAEWLEKLRPQKQNGDQKEVECALGKGRQWVGV